MQHISPALGVILWRFCVWGGAERGLGEAQVSVAGISEELHWIFRAALGSYGKGHWPQLNSSISSSILIRKAQWFANSSQSFIRIKYCSLNDIYYYSANFFFFFNPSCPSILWLLPRSNCLFLGVQRSCIRLKEPPHREPQP